MRYNSNTSMKVGLRLMLQRLLLGPLMLGCLSTNSLARARPAVGRNPQAVTLRGQTKKNSSPKPLKATTPKVNPKAPPKAEDQANPEIEKLYDDSFGLYKSLRWSKAPDAKKLTPEQARSEFVLEQERLVKAIKEIEAALEASAQKDKQPKLQELYLYPQVLKRFINIDLLLNPALTKAEVWNKYRKLRIVVSKTPGVESTLRLLDSNPNSLHPIKSLDHQSFQDQGQDKVAFLVRGDTIRGIYTAHLVSRAKTTDDVLPLVKQMMAQELIRQYALSSSYLGEDPFVGLEEYASRLSDAGVILNNDPGKKPAKPGEANLSKELAFALQQETVPIPFDLSKDEDVKGFLKKAFSKLGAAAAGLSHADAQKAVEESMKSLLEGMGEDQKNLKTEIASNILSVEIPTDKPQNFPTIAEDLAKRATDQTLLPLHLLNQSAVEFGAGANGVSAEELQAFLDKLSGKLKAGFKTYYLNWLTKHGDGKTQNGDLKRLLENLIAVSQKTRKLPDGPANPGLIMQAKYKEIAAVNPREKLVETLKKMAQQGTFEDSRTVYKIQYMELDAAAHPDTTLGVGAASDAQIHELVMARRQKDLADWVKIKKILGFDFPGLHPTLREWMSHMTEGSYFNGRKKAALEGELKRALIRQALDTHPILSLTAAGNSRDLMEILVDPSKKPEDLEKPLKDHLAQSRKNLLRDIDNVLNYTKGEQIADFLLTSPNFGALVEADMPELKKLFAKEKGRRELVSPWMFLDQKVIQKFNRYLGNTYLATVVVLVATVVTTRMTGLQRVLEPLALSVNTQLNEFTFAFLGLMSYSTATNITNYFRDHKKRMEFELLFCNSTLRNGLLSAEELDSIRAREIASRNYALYTGGLNVLFLTIIARANLRQKTQLQNLDVDNTTYPVDPKTYNSIVEMRKDAIAFKDLDLPTGTFNEKLIEEALQARLEVVGDGAGVGYQEAAALLKSRIANGETWRPDVFSWETVRETTILKVPSFGRLNLRERQIVDAIRTINNIDRLQPLMAQAALFSIRGAR
jgi:hypothetical protein